MEAKGANMEPKGANMESNGAQMEPTWTPKCPKGYLEASKACFSCSFVIFCYNFGASEAKRSEAVLATRYGELIMQMDRIDTY